MTVRKMKKESRKMDEETEIRLLIQNNKEVKAEREESQSVVVNLRTRTRKGIGRNIVQENDTPSLRIKERDVDTPKNLPEIENTREEKLKEARLQAVKMRDIPMKKRRNMKIRKLELLKLIQPATVIMTDTIVRKNCVMKRNRDTGEKTDEKEEVSDPRHAFREFLGMY